MKRDLYGECNVDGTPVDVFTAECCLHCINPECSRSSFGKSKFDIRVNTWYDRFFSNPPKMKPDDSRYKDFAAQKFQQVNPELHLTTSWVESQKQEQETNKNKFKNPVSINTPLRQSQMLANQEEPKKDLLANQEEPKKDSWEASVTVDSKAPIVKPGERIKFSQ